MEVHPLRRSPLAKPSGGRLERNSLFPPHIPALDGIRGLAVAAVLLLHFVDIMAPTTFMEKIVVSIAAYGFLGVDLFFVLSGFLITGILFDAKSKPKFFKNFYMRRTLRISPLYFGVLALVIFVLRWLPWFQGAAMDQLLAQQSWAWSYMVNILAALRGTWAPPFISHFWSLAVEEHFYLLWPVVVFACARRPLMKVCIGLIISAVIFRVLLNPWEVHGSATLTPCRLDGLCMGAWLALVIRTEGSSEERLVRLKRIGLTLFGGGVLIFTGTLSIGSWIGIPHAVLHSLRGLGYVCFFSALLIAALTAKDGGGRQRLFTARPLLWLGKYSYGLYVFHHLISYFFILHGTLAWFSAKLPNFLSALLVQATLGLGLSLILAYISFHAFEKRFLSLKVHFESNAKSPPSAPTPIILDADIIEDEAKPSSSISDTSETA